MGLFYKQPEYFSRFRCLGGECPESCCDGWEIDWKNEEYEKLRTAECPEELKDKIDNSFSVNDERGHYTIALCDDGRCPFHDRKTELCSIQREIGEDYLGVVCRTYPRHYIKNNDQIIRWCVTSCPAVIDILIKDKRATEIETIPARDYDRLDRSTTVTDNAEAVRDDPIRRLRMELFDFYTGILLNNSRSFENSMILLALAVKHLTKAEENKDFDAIPRIIQSLTSQLNDPAVAGSVEDIKPNYQLKFKLVNNMLIKFFGNNSHIINIRALHDGDRLKTDNYLKGLENFHNAFDNKPYVLKSIIMNTFFDMNMPLGKLKRSLFENYAFFVLAAASIKTVAAAIGFSGVDIRENFKICVAEMSRSFSHDVKKADAMAEDIKQMGLSTPAHLALIIKG